MRATLRATRLAGRRMNSSSAPQVNPQVQKAVEAASKAYAQSAATVKRVAGPVGEKIGGALGGRSCLIRQMYMRSSHQLDIGQGSHLQLPICALNTNLTCRIPRTHSSQLESIRFALPTSLSSREDGSPNSAPHLGKRILCHLG